MNSSKEKSGAGEGDDSWGSTVLLVSHGISTILDNCTKVVWIEKGKLQMIGDAKTVCDAYSHQFD